MKALRRRAPTRRSSSRTSSSSSVMCRRMATSYHTREDRDGAAQESNLPSLGLPDLTGFEGPAYSAQPCRSDRLRATPWASRALTLTSRVAGERPRPSAEGTGIPDTSRANAGSPQLPPCSTPGRHRRLRIARRAAVARHCRAQTDPSQGEPTSLDAGCSAVEEACPP